MKTVIAIIITNVDGGGTLRHAYEMAEAWSREGIRVLFIYAVRRLIKVSFYEYGSVDKFVYFFDYDGKKLIKLLKTCQVGLIHVEHLLNAKPYMLGICKELKVPLVVTLHDYYFACPFIKLTNERDIYCGEKGEKACNECLAHREFYSDTLGRGIKDIKEWRLYWLLFLQEASLVIVPSRDMEQRIKRYFPLSTIHMRENPELISYESSAIQVGLIGNLSTAKGAGVIKEVLSLAIQKKAPIHFTLFGTLSDVRLTPEEGQYITILGPYKEENIYQIISCHPVNYFWFPGVCPETYSYTLSIPVRLHIPCLSSDIGAIASRIHAHHWGDTYPWEEKADEILKRLQEFDYHKFYNSNFVIDNTSFGSFEKFYAGIPYKENGGESQAIMSFPSPFDELPEVLCKEEFNELWKGAELAKKRKLLAHVDKNWLRSVWKEKGITYFLKKIKEKAMK
ncbi:glycosyltransferase [Megasphaera sp.]|uniref:glycosyltransferase n=1 Tax=Megasphaera sp. TaxID=2023260 RepID=UPI003F8021B7